ncbi:WD40 repeat domain-containing protein [Schlesneria paludicola]|uniref:WD40 repeat domain-containing protein n=1 Tax=Schlesneria paludicola TaxID=360056 RepID=UPI00029B0B96|nr:WD40 repeat domain-containing protein [Schlesneria paludicola]
MADTSLTASVGAPIYSHTTLLGGVAWVDEKRLVTAGRDGKTYCIDVLAPSVTEVTGSVPAESTARVRVLIGSKTLSFLEGRSDGTAVIAHMPETEKIFPIMTQRLVQNDDKKSTLIAVGGGGGERNAHRLVMETLAHAQSDVSTNDVTGTDAIRSAAIAATTPDKIVVLTESSGGAGRIFSLDGLTAAWVNVFPTDLVEARPQTLAIADDGTAVCIVSKDAGSNFSLQRYEYATGSIQIIPIPSGLTSTSADIYAATHHVRFWPGTNNAWILQLTENNAGVLKRSLRKLIWNETTGDASSAVIYPDAAGTRLCAEPVTRIDGGDGTVIVSAWDDGTLRVHRQKDSAPATEIVNITITGESVTAVALRLKPTLCVTALSKTAAASKTTARVWMIDESGHTFRKLADFIPTGTQPTVNSGILGWQGNTILVGTLDDSLPPNFQLEYFPLPQIFGPPDQTDPAKLYNVITAAGWVGGDAPVFGVADGRIWALDGAAYKLFPEPAPTPDPGQLVRAMAQPANLPIFAFALTLDANKIHVRKLASPGTDEDLPAPTINAPVTALAFSADERFLAMGSTSGQIEIWNLNTDGIPTTRKDDALNSASFPIQGLSFVNVDHLLRLAAIDHRGFVRVWGASNDGADPFEEKFVEKTDLLDIDHQSSLCWSKNGKSLAVASQSGNVFVIDVQARS